MTRPTGGPRGARSTAPRIIVQTLLGIALGFAGLAHLTTARQEFRAQVPSWLPVGDDLVVVVSGIIEIVLGAALLVTLVPALARWRTYVGLAVATFFVAIFPGNIAQFTEQRDAFGLDTDTARAVRLLFQPLLVVAALWSTDAWPWLVGAVRARRPAEPIEGA